MSHDASTPAAPATDAAEPAQEASPAPIWIIVLFALLGYSALLYLDDHGGGFNAKVYGPFTSFDELERAQPPPPGGGDPRKGKAVFHNTCEVCHQATGLGVPGQFPPLAGSDWVLAKGPSRIIRIVLNGAQGPITVKGTPFSNTMVPWKDVLSDEDIAAVLSYVRGNADWGNKAEPVTPAQVHAIREKIKDRSTPFSPDADLANQPDSE